MFANRSRYDIASSENQADFQKGEVSSKDIQSSQLDIVNVHCGQNGLGPNKFDEGNTMSDISDRVKKIVVEHLGADEDKVVDNASFIDDLGADSLDTVELVMAFEEEFGIEIPDDAAENIQSFGDAVKFIEDASQ